MKLARQQTGFSLIELMIAITLGLMITAMISTIFLAGTRSYTQDDRYARMQENGRFAMQALAQDLAMAGFWGYLTDSLATVAALGTNCGVTLDLQTPLAVLNSPTASAANSAFPCIGTSTFVAGTDVVAIKRVAGGTTTSGFVTNAAYLNVDGSSGTLLQYSGTGPTVAQTFWRYTPRIYYIRNKTTASGQTVPTLYRKTLNTSLAMVDEEVAEGIDNIQVQFGIDTDSTLNGMPNYFTPSPSATDLNKAFVARITVLARSVDPNPDESYTNDKTFDLGEGIVGPFNDKFHRYVFATTVALRNRSYQARF